MTNFNRITPGGGLTAHEAAGGHTLARHVGLTETELAHRLATQRALPRASSFDNRDIAEQAISGALDANQTQITNWLADTTARFQINHTATNSIGVTLARGAASTVPAQNLQIVLKRDSSLALGYYILTAYQNHDEKKIPRSRSILQCLLPSRLGFRSTGCSGSYPQLP